MYKLDVEKGRFLVENTVTNSAEAIPCQFIDFGHAGNRVFIVNSNTGRTMFSCDVKDAPAFDHATGEWVVYTDPNEWVNVLQERAKEAVTANIGEEAIEEIAHKTAEQMGDELMVKGVNEGGIRASSFYDNEDPEDPDNSALDAIRKAVDIKNEDSEDPTKPEASIKTTAKHVDGAYEPDTTTVYDLEDPSTVVPTAIEAECIDNAKADVRQAVDRIQVGVDQEGNPLFDYIHVIAENAGAVSGECLIEDAHITHDTAQWTEGWQQLRLGLDARTVDSGRDGGVEDVVDSISTTTCQVSGNINDEWDEGDAATNWVIDGAKADIRAAVDKIEYTYVPDGGDPIQVAEYVQVQTNVVDGKCEPDTTTEYDLEDPTTVVPTAIEAECIDNAKADVRKSVDKIQVGIDQEGAPINDYVHVWADNAGAVTGECLIENASITHDSAQWTEGWQQLRLGLDARTVPHEPLGYHDTRSKDLADAISVKVAGVGGDQNPRKVYEMDGDVPIEGSDWIFDGGMGDIRKAVDRTEFVHEEEGCGEAPDWDFIHTSVGFVDGKTPTVWGEGAHKFHDEDKFSEGDTVKFKKSGVEGIRKSVDAYMKYPDDRDGGSYNVYDSIGTTAVALHGKISDTFDDRNARKQWLIDGAKKDVRDAVDKIEYTHIDSTGVETKETDYIEVQTNVVEGEVHDIEDWLIDDPEDPEQISPYINHNGDFPSVSGAKADIRKAIDKVQVGILEDDSPVYNYVHVWADNAGAVTGECLIEDVHPTHDTDQWTEGWQQLRLGLDARVTDETERDGGSPDVVDSISTAVCEVKGAVKVNDEDNAWDEANDRTQWLVDGAKADIRKAVDAIHYRYREEDHEEGQPLEERVDYITTKVGAVDGENSLDYWYKSVSRACDAPNPSITEVKKDIRKAVDAYLVTDDPGAHHSYAIVDAIGTKTMSLYGKINTEDWLESDPATQWTADGAFGDIRRAVDKHDYTFVPETGDPETRTDYVHVWADNAGAVEGEYTGDGTETHDTDKWTEGWKNIRLAVDARCTPGEAMPYGGKHADVVEDAISTKVVGVEGETNAYWDEANEKTHWVIDGAKADIRKAIDRIDYLWMSGSSSDSYTYSDFVTTATGKVTGDVLPDRTNFREGKGDIRDAVNPIKQDNDSTDPRKAYKHIKVAADVISGSENYLDIEAEDADTTAAGQLYAIIEKAVEDILKKKGLCNWYGTQAEYDELEGSGLLEDGVNYFICK